MSGKKLFVAGLKFTTTEQTIKEGFGQYGTVSQVHMPTDKLTGKFRGFAFVTFENPDDADKAVAGLNKTIFDGREISIQEAIEKQRK